MTLSVGRASGILLNISAAENRGKAVIVGLLMLCLPYLAIGIRGEPATTGHDFRTGRDPRRSNSAELLAINSCPATPLSGGISSKAGVQNSRIWNIEVDSGPSAAFGTTINSFALTQTFGAACTPVIDGPSFPAPVGYIPPNGSTIVPVTIDFTGCSAIARFTLTVSLSANGGTSTGSIVRNNEFR